MRKVRNAVIIIILCLIGGYSSYKPHGLGLASAPERLRDAVAGNGIGRFPPTNASNPNPNLHMSDDDADSLHDSVAGNAVPGFGGNLGGNVPGAPRGATDGGFGSFSQQNPVSQTAPNPLSQSGPASPSSPPK